MASSTLSRVPLQVVRRVGLAVPRTVNVASQRTLLPARYDPFEEMHKSMDRMFRDFDRLFQPSPFFGRGRGSLLPALGQFQSRALPIETVDKDKRLLRIEVDLPEFKPEDIQVTVKQGEVQIVAKSESGSNSQDDGSGLSVKESREFLYRYSLPKDADLDKVRSLLKADGRLVIETPLPPQIEAAPEATKPAEDQEIPIKKQ